MNILIMENGFNDLKKSRFPLGEYFKIAGHMVYYACPDPREDNVIDIQMNRNSLSFSFLKKGYFKLREVESNMEIDAVLSFRLIPNVLNFLCSFRSSRIKRIAVVTGLGYAFIPTKSNFILFFQRTLIKFFYKIASSRIQIVTQNPDDLKDLGLKNGKLILGSGDSLQEFNRSTEFYTESLQLLYAGRLLKSKGIDRSVEIFKHLRSRRSNVVLTILGEIDVENPDSISEAQLSELRGVDGINYLGRIDEIHLVYEKSNLLLYPSMYREGVPRVIIESLKYGLTIVTTDMPGCRETVRNNGFLISKSCKTQDIVDYILGLDAPKLLDNSRQSSKLFTQIFSRDVVFPQYLGLIE